MSGKILGLLRGLFAQRQGPALMPGWVMESINPPLTALAGGLAGHHRILAVGDK